MNKLQNMVLDWINDDKKLLTIKELNVEGVRQYASTLCTNGYAEMRGTDQECQSICVTVQGAIEDALSKMLYSGEVNLLKQCS